MVDSLVVLGLPPVFAGADPTYGAAGRQTMIAVIFEVWPADGRKESYLDHAARLRP